MLLHKKETKYEDIEKFMEILRPYTEILTDLKTKSRNDYISIYYKNIRRYEKEINLYYDLVIPRKNQ